MNSQNRSCEPGPVQQMDTVQGLVGMTVPGFLAWCWRALPRLVPARAAAYDESRPRPRPAPAPRRLGVADAVLEVRGRVRGGVEDRAGGVHDGEGGGDVHRGPVRPRAAGAGPGRSRRQRDRGRQEVRAAGEGGGGPGSPAALLRERDRRQLPLRGTYVSDVERGARNLSLLASEAVAAGLSTPASELFRRMERAQSGGAEAQAAE